MSHTSSTTVAVPDGGLERCISIYFYPEGRDGRKPTMFVLFRGWEGNRIDGVRRKGGKATSDGEPLFRGGSLGMAGDQGRGERKGNGKGRDQGRP